MGNNRDNFVSLASLGWAHTASQPCTGQFHFQQLYLLLVVGLKTGRINLFFSSFFCSVLARLSAFSVCKFCVFTRSVQMMHSLFQFKFRQGPPLLTWFKKKTVSLAFQVLHSFNLIIFSFPHQLSVTLSILLCFNLNSGRGLPPGIPSVTFFYLDYLLFSTCNIMECTYIIVQVQCQNGSKSYPNSVLCTFLKQQLQATRQWPAECTCSISDVSMLQWFMHVRVKIGC